MHSFKVMVNLRFQGHSANISSRLSLHVERWVILQGAGTWRRMRADVDQPVGGFIRFPALVSLGCSWWRRWLVDGGMAVCEMRDWMVKSTRKECGQQGRIHS